MTSIPTVNEIIALLDKLKQSLEDGCKIHAKMVEDIKTAFIAREDYGEDLTAKLS